MTAPRGESRGSRASALVWSAALPARGTARTENGFDYHLHQVHGRVSAFRGARKVSAFAGHSHVPFPAEGGSRYPRPTGLPRGARELGRREEREEGPRCVGSEEGVVLVRGGDDEGERPSTPAVALSDNP